MQFSMKIEQEAIPIVRSSLETKRQALEFGLRQYQERQSVLEQQHQMNSEQFAKRFAAGELGDDADWFEWEYVLGAIKETQRQLKLLDTIRL